MYICCERTSQPYCQIARATFSERESKHNVIGCVYQEEGSYGVMYMYMYYTEFIRYV